MSKGDRVPGADRKGGRLRHSGEQCGHPVRRARSTSFPVEKWDAILAINLTSAFHTTAAALPGMRQGGLGADRQHRLGPWPDRQPVQDRPMSRPSTGSSACPRPWRWRRRGRAITCNAICPGYVLTPLVEAQIPEQMKVHNMDRETVIREVMLDAPALAPVRDGRADRRDDGLPVLARRRSDHRHDDQRRWRLDGAVTWFGGSAWRLQGGGAHGAFTWGVLDRLLEDDDLEIAGDLRHLGGGAERGGAEGGADRRRAARGAREAAGPALGAGRRGRRFPPVALDAALPALCGCWQRGGRGGFRRSRPRASRRRCFRPMATGRSGTTRWSRSCGGSGFRPGLRIGASRACSSARPMCGPGKIRVFSGTEITPEAHPRLGLPADGVPGGRDPDPRRADGGLLGRRLYREPGAVPAV